jgi:hypothetical protein
MTSERTPPRCDAAWRHLAIACWIAGGILVVGVVCKVCATSRYVIETSAAPPIANSDV